MNPGKQIKNGETVQSKEQADGVGDDGSWYLYKSHKGDQ